MEGKNINLDMVKGGLAEVYRGKQLEGFDSAPYLEVEAQARQTKRGIWSLGDEYISPREWRRKYKKR